MYKAIPYDQDVHYAIALQWWKDLGWKKYPTPIELPPTGVVIQYNDQPLSMVWIAKGDGVACWVTWFVSDRYSEKDIRDKSIDHLIETCIMLVKGWGYRQLITLTSMLKMKKRFAKFGFRLGDVKQAIYIKEL